MATFSKNDSPAPGLWSIAGRLTVLYTLSAAAILLAATLLLYQGLQTRLDREDRRFLSDKSRVLVATLNESGPRTEEQVVNEVSWEGKVRRFIVYYARMIDGDRHVLAETPHMPVPAAAFPPPAAESADPNAVEWKGPGGGHFLLLSIRVDRRSAGIRVLQMALDTTKEQALLFRYRRDMVVVLLFGVLLSAGAGLWVARSGLEPIEEITTAARRITPSQLYERIGSGNWPKELMELSQAFDRMLERLEESFKRLSQFSADMAHELRTPINTLMGEAEVTLSKPRDVEEYRQVLESSLEEYGVLSRLIDNLLFLARAENAEMRVEKTAFDTGVEIGKVREFHDVLASEQGVTLLSDGSAILTANRTLFRRAVSNLVSNALRYTPSGGVIAIRVRQQADQSVEVEVTDTGSGIAPQHLPKIFDRFYRADPVRSHESQEMGLGLSIVKSIMDLHGGAVSIESAPAKGTSITLRFPPAVASSAR